MSQFWSNWSGSVTCHPRELLYPNREEQIVHIVERAKGEGEVVRVAGSGHSFLPLCATGDALLSLDGLQGIESIDTNSSRAWVRAGTKIHALGELLASNGLALANQGDVDVQAIAGAVSTGTHGTGPTLGSISTQVTGLRLVTADAHIVEWTLEGNADLLAAGRVSLGSLGVITAVQLQLLPLYRLHEQTRREPIDACLQSLPERVAANRHYEFFWYPGDDCALTKTLNPTDRPATVRQEATAEGSGLAGSEGERVDDSWRIFPTVRENRFNEMEYSLPAERGVDCFLAIRDLMRSKHTDMTWPVEYRTQAADDILISAAHGRATVAISIHQGANLPHAAFFEDAEAIFRQHEGRPHWAKIHHLGGRELETLYPRWQDFQAIRSHLDPEGRFLNDHLRRLFENT